METIDQEDTGTTAHAYQVALGERLRAVRQKRGLSLEQLEEQTGGRFKAGTVRSYERGTRAAGVARLAELAEFYQVPVAKLLPDSDARVDTGVQLRVKDIAKLWGTSVRTVNVYLHESKPTPETVKKPHRYEDNPMPMPVYTDRQRPVWVPEVKKDGDGNPVLGEDGQPVYETLGELNQRLLDWWNSRPGTGTWSRTG